MKVRLSAVALALGLLALAGCVPETLLEGGEPPVAGTPPHEVQSQRVEIASGGQSYPAYYALPAAAGSWPGVVLLHSINGLDPGYETLSDRLAAAGYAVLALEWQTYERVPHDDVTAQLVREGVAFLDGEPNVDGDRLGLTGFCIGGRYTMLLLPQIASFKAGVAWYGFPYRGGDDAQVLQPAEVLDQLEVPMLILHGTADNPSPIADIYRYAAALDEAGKYFELKVYQGEPHSFVLDDGELSDSSAAQDAVWQMISFFDRTL